MKVFFLSSMLLTLSALTTQAQRKVVSGTVRDEHSGEPVLFASIQFKNTSVGGATDTAGNFTIRVDKWPSDTLEITCVGYQKYLVYLDKNKDSVYLPIDMERGTFNEGVQVKARVNKGLLLWRKIVEHKPQNNRYRFDNFS